jgi:hypothetical protein
MCTYATNKAHNTTRAHCTPGRTRMWEEDYGKDSHYTQPGVAQRRSSHGGSKPDARGTVPPRTPREAAKGQSTSGVPLNRPRRLVRRRASRPARRVITSQVDARVRECGCKCECIACSLNWLTHSLTTVRVRVRVRLGSLTHLLLLGPLTTVGLLPSRRGRA